MDIKIRIENARVEGEWIEGDIVIGVTDIGLSKTQHFKTKQNAEETFDLGVATLKVRITLNPPNQVCLEGKISKGFISFDIPKQCFPIGG